MDVGCYFSLIISQMMIYYMNVLPMQVRDIDLSFAASYLLPFYRQVGQLPFPLFRDCSGVECNVE